MTSDKGFEQVPHISGRRFSSERVPTAHKAAMTKTAPRDVTSRGTKKMTGPPF
jgi:hypothetical protein